MATKPCSPNKTQYLGDLFFPYCPSYKGAYSQNYICFLAKIQGCVKSPPHLLSALDLLHDILITRHELYPKMQLKQTGEGHGTTWPFSAYPRAVPCPALFLSPVTKHNSLSRCTSKRWQKATWNPERVPYPHGILQLYCFPPLPKDKILFLLPHHSSTTQPNLTWITTNPKFP